MLMKKIFYLYSKSLLSKLALVAILVIGGGNSAWGQTILFQQNFNSGTLPYTQNVAYTKTSGLANIVGDDDNLFTSITTNNKDNSGIAINNITGGNDVDATGFFRAYINNTGNNAYWYVCRTKDFAATAPTAIQMSMDVYVEIISGASDKYGIRFAIGDGFDDGKTYGYAPLTSYVHSGFCITAETSPTLCQYSNASTDIYNTALTQSTWLSIVWVINNSGEALTYNNPTGSGTSTVNNDCFDLWLKTTANNDNTYTRVVTGQAATTATKDLQEIYIGSSAGRRMDFRMDNIIVRDLASVAAPYTVTFDAGSHGDCGTSSLTEASAGAGVTLPAVTPNTGYTFDGWYTSSDSKVGDASDTYNPTGDITLYAHYTAKSYTITLDDNGGSADGEAIATFDSNTLSSLSAPTYSGHAVVGYYKEAELTNLIADSEGNLEENTDYTDASGNWTYDDDVTLYAKWQDLTPYTVSFNVNEHGSCATASLTEAAGGAGVTLPSVTPATHYVFNGWYDAASGGAKMGDAGETYYPTSDITLYAQYTLIHTVTYNGNGSTGGDVPVDSNSPYDDGTTVTVLGNTASLVKTGYTFMGWNTESNGSGTNYSVGSTFDIDDDITLYAVWAENYCELVPNTSGTAASAETTVKMQSGAYGGTMTANTTLSYTENGLVFGYGADPGATVVLNDYLKVGSTINVTIYAEGNGTRGLHLYTNAETPTKVISLNIESATLGDVKTIQYKVVAEDGLEGTNSFQLRRNSNVSLKSLTVTDCQPGGIISDSGWNTYSSNKKLDLSSISSGTAYVASTINYSENKVIIKKCTAIVDAEEGLMIKGEPGIKFTINTSSSAATLSETNLLEGLPNGGTVSRGNYVFGWPTLYPENYGFYYINATEPYLGAGKAYLSNPGISNNARLTIVFDDDLPTGVDTMFNKTETNDKVYNLQGQRVNAPQKGIYIVNGKKFINK